MPTILITGANRGLGFEFARQYSQEDWHVIATCRNLGQATHLESLSGKIEIKRLISVVTTRGSYPLLLLCPEHGRLQKQSPETETSIIGFKKTPLSDGVF